MFEYNYNRKPKKVKRQEENDTTLPWEQKNAGYKSTMSLSEAQYEEVVIPEIRGTVKPLDFSENRGIM